MSILLLAEHDNGVLSNQTYKTISAATQIGGDIDVLVAGQNIGAVAQAAAQVLGVTRVLVADAVEFAHDLAEPLAALLLGLAGGYDTIIAAATATGKSVLPRVAALLDVAQISEIVAVLAPDTFKRPIYAGNALQTVRATDAKRVITVRTSAFAAAGTGGSAPIVTVAGVGDPGVSRFVSEAMMASERPDLSAARVVVSGGRALGSKDNFDALILPLADRLNAAVGASRAAVDAGYVPNDCQVGQTGKIVAPELYIAIGISGAIQHIAGMKDSKVIVAINRDAEAPIFQVADYGLVGDIFELLPQLQAALPAPAAK